MSKRRIRFPMNVIALEPLWRLPGLGGPVTTLDAEKGRRVEPLDDD
jgi:hypothetical protein